MLSFWFCLIFSFRLENRMEFSGRSASEVPQKTQNQSILRPFSEPTNKIKQPESKGRKTPKMAQNPPKRQLLFKPNFLSKITQSLQKKRFALGIPQCSMRFCIDPLHLAAWPFLGSIFPMAFLLPATKVARSIWQNNSNHKSISLWPWICLRSLEKNNDKPCWPFSTAKNQHHLRQSLGMLSQRLPIQDSKAFGPFVAWSEKKESSFWVASGWRIIYIHSSLDTLFHFHEFPIFQKHQNCFWSFSKHWKGCFE